GLDAEVAEDPLIDEAQFPHGTPADAPVRVLAGALSLRTPRPMPRRGSYSLAPGLVAGRFEAEDGTSVPVDRVIGAVDAQLTAHPQMDEQAELRLLPEAEPHELPSPFGTDDPVAGDRGDEPVDGGRVDASGRGRAQDSGIEHLGAGDRRARRPFVDAATDAFDLGQLRHRATCTPTETTCTPTTGTLSASVVRVDGSDGFDGDLRGRGLGGLLRG